MIFPLKTGHAIGRKYTALVFARLRYVGIAKSIQISNNDSIATFHSDTFHETIRKSIQGESLSNSSSVKVASASSGLSLSLICIACALYSTLRVECPGLSSLRLMRHKARANMPSHMGRLFAVSMSRDIVSLMISSLSICYQSRTSKGRLTLPSQVSSASFVTSQSGTVRHML
jgi:hypothetical protein